MSEYRSQEAQLILTNLNLAFEAAARFPPALCLGATSAVSMASDSSLPDMSEASESSHGLFFFFSPFFEPPMAFFF